MKNLWIYHNTIITLTYGNGHPFSVTVHPLRIVAVTQKHQRLIKLLQDINSSEKYLLTFQE